MWWVLANAFWVERRMTSPMNMGRPQWTEAWDKTHDPLRYLITPTELQVYVLQTVIAYAVD